jgi:hypothetical protein
MTAWQLPGLDCMMRLTAMVLAGYVEYFSEHILQKKLASNSSPTAASSGPAMFISPPKKQSSGTPASAKLSHGIADSSRSSSSAEKHLGPLSPGLMSFPLPVAGMNKSKGALRASTGSGFSPTPSRSGSPVVGDASCTPFVESGKSMSVACVKLSRAEDVEMIWLDTIKIFADMSNWQPIEVARKSSFCLQATVLAGGVTSLPVELWAKAIAELLDRLPLSLVAATSRLTTSQEYALSADACLRSCNVLFDVFVNQIKLLRTCTEFQNLWLRFTGILATNTCALPRGVHFHEEMLEMIAALMRLLRPPVMPPTPVSAAQPAPQQVQQPAPESRGALSFLFSWASSPEPTPEPVAVAEAEVAPKLEEPEPETETAVSTPQKFSPDDNEDEGNLLMLSWRAMCSLNPALQGNLKLKNPQLVADLTRFAELQERRAAAGYSSASFSLGSVPTPARKVKSVPAPAVAASVPASSADTSNSMQHPVADAPSVYSTPSTETPTSREGSVQYLQAAHLQPGSESKLLAEPTPHTISQVTSRPARDVPDASAGKKSLSLPPPLSLSDSGLAPAISAGHVVTDLSRDLPVESMPINNLVRTGSASPSGPDTGSLISSSVLYSMPPRVSASNAQATGTSGSDTPKAPVSPSRGRMVITDFTLPRPSNIRGTGTRPHIV